MKHSFLNLPERTAKPRRAGLTVMIDNGVPVGRFRDVIASHAPLIDMVKFGWGTALVTPFLDQKLETLRAADIPFFFGGTLFEKAFVQGRVEAFRDFLREVGAGHVEISNGSVPLTNSEKAVHVRAFAAEFVVLSEVGYKDASRSHELYPAQWIECIQEDLEAGATWVITEARESGTSGMCRPDGELRKGLVAEILDSEIPSERLIFEAPTKSLQVEFVRRLGPNANLANIAFSDVVALETLRMGLRADTIMDFSNPVGADDPVREGSARRGRLRIQ